jgi:hypothetical protein
LIFFRRSPPFEEEEGNGISCHGRDGEGLFNRPGCAVSPQSFSADKPIVLKGLENDRAFQLQIPGRHAKKSPIAVCAGLTG